MIRASQGLWLGKAWLGFTVFLCLACLDHIGGKAGGVNLLEGRPLDSVPATWPTPLLSACPLSGTGLGTWEGHRLGWGRTLSQLPIPRSREPQGSLERNCLSPRAPTSSTQAEAPRERQPHWWRARTEAQTSELFHGLSWAQHVLWIPP